MRFKTLKHKTLEDTFGMFHENEIYHCSIPSLQPMTVTMENVMSYLSKSVMSNNDVKDILSQLNDYDLIEVDIKII